jgi:hypothetical protein
MTEVSFWVFHVRLNYTIGIKEGRLAARESRDIYALIKAER